jgi:glycine amidinotransferase
VKLNSYDDWSPLKEIVVGSADGYREHAADLSFDLFFYDNLTQDNQERSHGYYPRIGAPSTDGRRLAIKQRYVEELNEDVEGIADTLSALGVTVLRPIRTVAGEITTPAWSAPVLPPLNLRDNTLVLGDEIIETPPMLRARYFETQFLKPIFLHYFAVGARWTQMPRPWMTDASFDVDAYGDRTIGSTEGIRTAQPSPFDVGLEPMIDAAQCLRLGRDLVVNIATANHAMACDWLERHLAGRFRVHRMFQLTDGHIDSAVLALRPGVLLVRSPDVVDHLPPELKKWKAIVAPEPRASNFPEYEDDDLILTSQYIDLNVLSISQDTVMVNDGSPDLARLLEQHGFTTVPVRHRHRRLFGGGLHCFTLDTVREGGANDYFA